MHRLVALALLFTLPGCVIYSTSRPCAPSRGEWFAAIPVRLSQLRGWPSTPGASHSAHLTTLTFYGSCPKRNRLRQHVNGKRPNQTLQPMPSSRGTKADVW